MDSEIPDTKNCNLMFNEFKIGELDIRAIKNALILCIELLGDGDAALKGCVAAKNALEILRVTKDPMSRVIFRQHD